MITIFNRKELFITMDMGRQAEVCNNLSANGIKHTVKVTNLQRTAAFGWNRGRVGTFGVNLNHSYEYKIYVHKNDFEYALSLIK